MSTGWSNISVSNGSQAGDDDIPACASCKKRKLRCSRETPTCSHCERLGTECIYNPKQKPGLKPGAVEALTRRVAFLEQILLDDDGNIRPQYNAQDVSNRNISDGDVHSTGGFVATLQREDNRANDDAHDIWQNNQPGTLHDEPEQLNRGLNPLKRKLNTEYSESWRLASDDIDLSQHLPDQPLLEKIAEFFCISFHHWIPYIHKQRLQKRVREGLRDARFDLFLHALVAVTLRHMSPDMIFLDKDQIQQQVATSRSTVEVQAIRHVSAESLQALILVVFDHLNNGQAQRAWPLIGLLTRAIDYLQLTTEPSTTQVGSLMKPVRLVQPSNDHTQLEERRRLFWVIFLLDRFCSISTGWNTSLTADDVHRRLPADGGFFTREEPVITPYFGIWNKAAARIGRSLANVPAQYNEEDPGDVPSGASPSSANGYIDASKLGAFAYCVEATESLSQVTTFFLQQRINWQDKEHAVNWLTRFKELDLRLVHWKIFLPSKWKDSDISSDRSVVDMDPNLTLAHITHNASMILLHHPIAFPPRVWNNYVALPKECSAQTCELAAVETSNIVDKFLAHTPIPFVNAQFAFCAFVAAKALLFDHQALRRPLRPEFQRLVRDLWDMSDRWTGRDNVAQAGRAPINQAGLYAHHLESLQNACQQDARFNFDLYDHSCGSLDSQQHVSPIPVTTPLQQHSMPNKRPSIQQLRHNSMNSASSTRSPRQISSMTGTLGPMLRSPTVHVPHGLHSQPATVLSPPLPSPAVARMRSGLSHNPQLLYHANPPNTAIPHQQQLNKAYNESTQDQSLLTLSDGFLDAQFLDMDRVITFEDANFFMPWQ